MARQQGADVGGGLGGLADQAASLAQEVNDHIATGSAECRYCPVCRVVHAVRETSPEVRTHLLDGGDLAAAGRGGHPRDRAAAGPGRRAARPRGRAHRPRRRRRRGSGRRPMTARPHLRHRHRRHQDRRCGGRWRRHGPRGGARRVAGHRPGGDRGRGRRPGRAASLPGTRSPRWASAPPATSTPTAPTVLFAPNIAWRDEPLGRDLVAADRAAGHHRERRQRRSLGRVPVRRRPRRRRPADDHRRHRRRWRRHRRRPPAARWVRRRRGDRAPLPGAGRPAVRMRQPRLLRAVRHPARRWSARPARRRSARRCSPGTCSTAPAATRPRSPAR